MGRIDLKMNPSHNRNKTGSKIASSVLLWFGNWIQDRPHENRLVNEKKESEPLINEHHFKLNTFKIINCTHTSSSHSAPLLPRVVASNVPSRFIHNLVRSAIQHVIAGRSQMFADQLSARALSTEQHVTFNQTRHTCYIVVAIRHMNEDEYGFKFATMLLLSPPSRNTR